jgi:hypothetical protein
MNTNIGMLVATPTVVGRVVGRDKKSVCIQPHTLSDDGTWVPVKCGPIEMSWWMIIPICEFSGCGV